MESILYYIINYRERSLRVHKDDDPYDIAENFCRVYGMKEEIKERLAKTILQFMSLYLIKSNDATNSSVQINKNNEGNQQLPVHQINEFSQNNLNLDEI